METAPYFEDISKSDRPAQAVWAQTSDGVRIRLAYWGAEKARGTVLIFTGRTEYIEKYSLLAQDLNRVGFAVASADWRGQGVAGRMLDNPLLGHVGLFHDYQRDVAELLRWLEDQGAPRPWHLLAHSMGGTIALRSLINGMDVQTAVFSAPMCGIAVPWIKRPVAATVPALARRLGRELNLIPGGDRSSHIMATSFKENLLTTDRAHYDWFREQLERHPDLQLAGPSIRWLGEAMAETRALKSADFPDIPTLVLLGSDEEIVSSRAIEDMVERWDAARLVKIDGARHEIFMERDALRDKALRMALDHMGASEPVA